MCVCVCGRVCVSVRACVRACVRAYCVCVFVCVSRAGADSRPTTAAGGRPGSGPPSCGRCDALPATAFDQFRHFDETSQMAFD